MGNIDEEKSYRIWALLRDKAIEQKPNLSAQELDLLSEMLEWDTMQEELGNLSAALDAVDGSVENIIDSFWVTLHQARDAGEL